MATCAADMQAIRSPLASLRFHDLRHQAIIELAESQTSEQTILDIAGHVSSRMLRHYSHIRTEAKREAVSFLSAHRPNRDRTAGYDTNEGTNTHRGIQVGSEVIENMVGTRRLELLTSTVSR